MDHESLRTASTYLNNLLLARGLLRNSEPIDFVKPSKESRAQIINLVHDLILRDDREREQREHVATTIRTLRAEDTRKNHEIERLVAKTEESSRALTQAQTAERTAKTEVKKVESAMKSLQDQAAKMKSTLALVKTQCANDVRKRDWELERLKMHLQGQQRGRKVGMAAPSITITGAPRKSTVDASVHDLGDPEYSLRQETTEFLTQLSQGLSDENDSLINLLRGAVGTMRELLGVPATHKHPDSAIGSVGSNEDGKRGPDMLHALPTSYETLAADVESTLAQLKSILTNPNFVSVEEVEVRDEEIVRLREAFEHMAQRWKDVLQMMEGWLKKMNTGVAINVEDLRQGMGLVSPEHLKNGVRNARHESDDSSILNGDISEIKLPSDDADSSLILELSRPTSNGKTSPKRKRDVLEPPEFFDLRPSSTRHAPPSPERAIPSATAEEEAEEDFDADFANLPEENENGMARMTVAQKLDVAREEAEEAKTRGKPTTFKSKLPRSTSYDLKPSVSFGLDGSCEAENEDVLERMSPVVKKTKIRGRPRRRKSTLSPEELEELIRSTEA